MSVLVVDTLLLVITGYKQYIYILNSDYLYQFFSFHKVLLVMVYLICHWDTVNLLLLQTLLEMETQFIVEVTIKVSRPAEQANRPFVQQNDCFGLKKVVRLNNSLNFLNFSLYHMSC